MMSDFRGDGGSEMTPKNQTLEGKNWTLGGEGGSKIVKNRRTSFMDVPLLREIGMSPDCFVLIKYCSSPPLERLVDIRQ